jgi:hypothetical protein
MNTDDASAGSIFIARNASGISVPAVAATNMLMIIAAPMITPSAGLPFQIHTTMPATRPQAMPFATPTTASFSSAFRVFAHDSSPRAIPRMMTVSVCIAALPPIPATTGMKTASALHWLMVPSNIATTDAATNAVTRFTCSQGNRFLSDSIGRVNTRSSPVTPTRR